MSVDDEPKPKQKRRFSRKQLRASQGLLIQQAKTNIYASQCGMTCFGAVRHGSDIRADKADQTGQGMLTLQAATHIYASQKGMTGFGAVRHGSDIKADDASLEGLSSLTLQTGTNKYASQKGMTSFGAVRHGSDIKVRELYEEGDDDEYPTDEEDPLPVPKPGRKLRDDHEDLIRQTDFDIKQNDVDMSGPAVQEEQHVPENEPEVEEPEVEEQEVEEQDTSYQVDEE